MDVLAFLADATVRDIGAGTLVVVIVVMILTERLIPRRTHLREIAELLRQVEEFRTSRDAWNVAHTTSEKARRDLGKQFDKLYNESRTAAAKALEQQPSKDAPHEVA